MSPPNAQDGQGADADGLSHALLIFANRQHEAGEASCYIEGDTRHAKEYGRKWGVANQAKNDLEAMHTRLLAQLAAAEADRARLNWLLEYITSKGLRGLSKLAWTVYDEDGESLMHRKSVREDEVGEIKFDRAAIDTAMTAAPKGTK